MGKKIEWLSGEGEHYAYMTLEEQEPEAGEDTFLYPVFTDVSSIRRDTVDFLIECMTETYLLNSQGEYLGWDDGDEYLDALPIMFRANGSVSAHPVP